MITKYLLSIVVFAISLLSCTTVNDPEIVAVLPGLDTIRLPEYHYALQAAKNKGFDIDLTNVRKHILNDIIEKRFLLHEAKARFSEDEIQKWMPSERSFLLKKANEKLIESRFLNEIDIHNFVKFNSWIFNVRFLSLSYKTDLAKREIIKKRADSISNVITNENFGRLTHEYADASGLRLTSFPFYDLPPILDRFIVAKKPPFVTKSVEIDGVGFVLCQVVSAEPQPFHIAFMPEEVYEKVYTRNIKINAPVILDYRTRVQDSIVTASGLEYNEKNIGRLVREQQKFSNDLLQLTYGSINGQPITGLSFLDPGKFGATAALYDDTGIRSMIDKFVLDEHMIRQLKETEYFKQGAIFRDRLELLNDLWVGKLDKDLKQSVFIGEMALKKYYENHKAMYFEPGDITFHEFFTADEDIAQLAENKLNAEVDFMSLDQFVLKNKSVRVQANIKSPFDRNDVVINEARNLKVGEVSKIIRRFGGYSIIKVVSKNAPRLIGYEVAGDDVRADAYREKLNILKLEIISKYATKFPPVIYEN